MGEWVFHVVGNKSGETLEGENCNFVVAASSREDIAEKLDSMAAKETRMERILRRYCWVIGVSSPDFARTQEP